MAPRYFERIRRANGEKRAARVSFPYLAIQNSQTAPKSRVESFGKRFGKPQIYGGFFVFSSREKRRAASVNPNRS